MANTPRDSILSDLFHLRQLPTDTPRMKSQSPPFSDDITDVASSPRLNAAMDILSKSRDKQSSRSSSKTARKPSTNSLLASLAIEEERQASEQLKALLHSTNERLQYEMERAEDAMSRADVAESRTRDALSQLNFSQRTLREDVSSANSRNEQLQVHVEAMNREVKRLNEELDRVRRERSDAMHSEAQSRDAVRKHKNALADYRARVQGEDEGRNSTTKALLEGYFNEGYERGYQEGQEDGYENGFEDGLKSGRKQGFREGRHKGRSEEREKAMAAFNKFLADEVTEYESVDSRFHRTQTWAESLYQETSEGSIQQSPVIGRRGR